VCAINNNLSVEAGGAHGERGARQRVAISPMRRRIHWQDQFVQRPPQNERLGGESSKAPPDSEYEGDISPTIGLV